MRTTKALGGAAFAALLTGCGPIIAGVVLGTSGSGGGSTSPPPAPTLEAAASVARPAMVDGKGAPSASEVAVPYTLTDSTSAALDVDARWRLASESDASLRTATPASTSERTTNLVSTPQGTAHAFVWAAGQDLAALARVEEDVVLDLTPVRQGTRGRSRAIALRVGNRAPVPTIEAATAPQGRTVLTAFNVVDSSSDDSTVVLSVRDVASTGSGTTVVDLNVGAGVTIVLGDDAGRRSTIAWDSARVFGVANISQVEIVVTVTDAFGARGEARSLIEVRNDTPPQAQILAFGTQSGVAAVSGRIPIRFALFDDEADARFDPSGASGAVDAIVEVSADNGATWVPATGLVLREHGRTLGSPRRAGCERCRLLSARWGPRTSTRSSGTPSPTASRGRATSSRA